MSSIDAVKARLHSYFLNNRDNIKSVGDVSISCGYVFVKLEVLGGEKTVHLDKRSFDNLIRLYQDKEVFFSKLVLVDNCYINSLYVSDLALGSIGVKSTSRHLAIHTRPRAYSYSEFVDILSELNRLSLYEKILLGRGQLSDDRKNLIRLFNSQDWLGEAGIDWVKLREVWNLFLSKRYRLTIERETLCTVAIIIQALTDFSEPSPNVDQRLASFLLESLHRETHSKDELRILYPALNF